MDLRTISEYGSLYFYPRLELRHDISMYVKAYLDLSLRFGRNGPVLSFTFSPAQWALPQLNGPVQLHSLVVDKTVD